MKHLEDILARRESTFKPPWTDADIDLLLEEVKRLRSEVDQRNNVIEGLYQCQAKNQFERDIFRAVVESMYRETPGGWTWANGPDSQEAWEAYRLWRERNVLSV